MGTIKIKKDGEWVKLPNYGIEEFPDAPSDGKTYGRKNKQWSEIIASNQYLDITAILPSEGNTLSDENYQKVVAAWENGIALARMDNTYVPMVIEKGEGDYLITMNTFMPSTDGLSAGVMALLINADKTYVMKDSHIDMHNNGDGTKYLSDNGQYKAITTSSGALPQETQNNILDAINAINFTDSNKTTVTAQEYNAVVSAFDGKITPNSDNMWNISYDKITSSKFSENSAGAPILGAYLIFDEFSSISVISYSTFYDYYYATMGNAKVGEVALEIKDVTNGYALTCRNNISLPVKSYSVSNIIALPQTEYDNLTSKDSNTLYIIKS